MCGIAGFFDAKNRLTEGAMSATLGRMNHAILHRGPDDGGTWADARCGIGLGMRRLSIVDLSPAGHQPMVSHDGRYVIVFNGEIYNFQEVRARVADASPSPFWRGASDTEVLLEAMAHFGLEKALQECVGMFAFALWDRNERRLWLGRDRIGEKPLYYGRSNGVFLFGSELKALAVHPAWRGEIDRDALARYTVFGHVSAPDSIYKGIFKLPPGTLLQVSVAAETIHVTTPAPYWSVREAVGQGVSNPFLGNEREAADELDRLLRQAVAAQMVADVPLGAFLSGGIDSSTVVALMQAQSARPIKTFTIGFHDADYNEAPYAAEIARHLGCDHTEQYITPEDARNVIPRLPDLYDEPFADSSQIPTFLVAQLARRQVTVSLSGDAGDELFGGYSRYFVAEGLWRKISSVPLPLRRAGAFPLRHISPEIWERLLRTLGGILPEQVPFYRGVARRGSLRDTLSAVGPRRLAEVLSCANADDLYRSSITHWQFPIVLPAVDTARDRSSATDWNASDLPSGAVLPDAIHRAMFADLLGYLPDDVLTKVDRATMGVSLESRVPLLDHRVIEFAWRLPLAFKVSQGQNKRLLRQVLSRYVPDAMVARPKMGFGVPIAAWLRGPLRDWAESLMGEARLRREGYFDPVPIRRAWEKHLSGEQDHETRLWIVLMFQAWHERWKNPAAV